MLIKEYVGFLDQKPKEEKPSNTPKATKNTKSTTSKKGK